MSASALRARLRLLGGGAAALCALRCVLPDFEVAADGGDGDPSGNLGGTEGWTDGSGGTGGASSGGGGGTGTGGSSACGGLEQMCCSTGEACEGLYECDGETCRNTRLWVAEQKLLAALDSGAADGAAEDQFGYAVAIDGDTALVGSSGDDDVVANSGSVYVFVRSGSEWVVQQKLTATLTNGTPDASEDSFFGGSVALDGDTAVVGCSLNDTLGTDSGIVYVFVRSGSTWTMQQKLAAAVPPDDMLDGAAGDEFGASVAISGDTLLVGSRGDGASAGSAYVYVRSGSTWDAQQKLTAALPGGTADGAAGDEFGGAVALDGDTALVGSKFDHGAAVNSGSAYVYVRSGSNWSPQQKLTAALPTGASDSEAYDFFGTSVALSGDIALVGSPGDDDIAPTSGSAYVYVRSDAIWTVEQKLTARLPGNLPDGAEGDEFGYTVALSGEIALVGSYRDDPLGVSSGSAYVYARSRSAWFPWQRLTAQLPDGEPDGAAYDLFAASIALDGETALIGSYGDDTSSGSAYVFVPE